MMRKDENQAILDAVLASDYAKEQRKERDVKDEIEFYGTPRRAMDFESDNIDGFFEEDLKEIVKVPEVWAWLQKRVKDQLDGVWLNPETVISRLDNHGYILSEQTIYDMLENLSDELVDLYKERIREAWSTMSLEAAKKTLPQGVYIALLDKDGKLTTEPHMVSMDLKSKVTWEIKEEPHPRLLKATLREIHVTVDPPIKTRSGIHAGIAVRLKDNEVKAEAFSIE